MKNQNNYNRQGSNYYQQQYQGQQNQMSNYPNQQRQPPYGQQPPYPQQGSQYGPPPYGQQPPYPQQNSQYNQPPPNQGPYGPPQGGNMPPQQYGQNMNQNDIPDFKLLNRGMGIDEREFYIITHSAADALNGKEDPLSNGIIKRIKDQMGGEWMVFASVEGLKGYDFSLSIVTGNDFLSFTIQNFRFQVCRLREASQ